MDTPMESEAERESSAPPLPQPHQAENASYFHQFNTTGASHTPQQKSPHDSLYQCQTCHHTFERADRLTRHLKSHENARQYRCQRCQKSFNRADLLNRHMITHNRQSNSRNNTIRIDRANRACSACAAAKVRCEDRKPCRRCWTKNISCDIATQTGQKKSISATNENLIDLSTSQLLTPPSTAVAQYIKTTDQPDLKSIFSDQASVYATEVQVQNTDDDEIISSSSIDTTMPSISNYDMGILQPEVVQVVFDNIMNEMLFFPNVAGFNTQSLEDNHLDFRFPDGLSEINSPLPMPMNEAGGAENGCQSKRDINAGYAAFKRSPWHYTPTAKDGILRDQENLTLNEGIICLDHSQILRSSRLTPDIPSCGFPTITAGQRDKMFHLLASMNKPLESVPGFPSLSILNHVMEAFFIEQNYQVGSWIHVPTISSPKNAIIPELLTAFVIAGSTLIPVPEIHKMGLVLQDVVRLKIAELWNRENSNTRKLQPLQAWMLSIDIGIWSGFQREVEISESFGQPLITMMRRGGMLSAPADSKALIPIESDSGQVLEAKWRKWAERESFKRLSINLFIHDTRASIALQKATLMSLSEITISAPASRALFLAGSAEEWKSVYMEQNLSMNPPHLNDIMHDIHILDDLHTDLDGSLCLTVAVHGFWGQIWAFRESWKFHGLNERDDSVHHPWLVMQQRELYRQITEFEQFLLDKANPQAELIITIELLLMILCVSPEELQHFAGKSGEDAATKAHTILEKWSNTEHARKSAWHAGQVFYWALRMPLAELRDFPAIAVYFASLALWTFGYLMKSSNQNIHHRSKDVLLPPGSQSTMASFVVLNLPETSKTHSFIAGRHFIPVLTTKGISTSLEDAELTQDMIVQLDDSGSVLKLAQDLYKRNFPLDGGPLPPLVANLGNLMRSLAPMTTLQHQIL